MRIARILLVLWSIVIVAASCSHTTTPPTTPSQLRISVSDTSVQALTPIPLAAIVQPDSSKFRVQWDFGEGTKVGDSTRSVTHSFSTLGIHLVKAFLFRDSTLLSQDSVQIIVLPIPGLTLDAFAQFHHGRMIFTGDNSWVGTSDVDPPPFSFASDSLRWIQYNFGAGKTYIFSGRLSDDLMAVDTITGDSVFSGSHYPPYDHEDANAHLSAGHVRIASYCSDSVVYRLVDISVKDHVRLSAYGHHVNRDYDWTKTYSGTDWNSSNPVPSLIIKFYK